MIRERSIAGQQAARARGRTPGRARSLSDVDESALVSEYLQGGATFKGLALKYGVTESTAKRAVYRVTKSPDYIRRKALLHKARPRRHSPDPRRSYAIAIVSGVPSSVKRLSNATRTCSSVTWRSNVRAITRSPSRLKQCILVSTKLRRW